MSIPRPLAAVNAFDSFVADVADALGDAMPAWRVRLSDAAAEWRARGIDATILERALTLSASPDVDALLATFARAVQQLAAYEAEAVALDSSLAGDDIFRDPARVRAAAARVAACRVRTPPRRSTYPDGEHWILQWPDVGDLLAGELA